MVVVRVSVLRCTPQQFPEMKKIMQESNRVLEPGIRRMAGLIHY